MLVKLMYEDADGIMNEEMHVNPRHIVSVCMRDDGRLGYMQLDSTEYRQRVDGIQYVVTAYCIDRESHDRIVAWMEKNDG